MNVISVVADRVRRWARRARGALAAVVAASLVALGLAVYVAPPPLAKADLPTGCNYADPGAVYEASTCWIQWDSYNAAQATGAGQPFSVYIGGGLTATFTLRAAGAATRSLDTPTYPDAYFDNNGYRGVDGRAALGGYNPNTTVTLENFQIRNAAGVQMTGYMVVGADAEDTSFDFVGQPAETIAFTADTPLTSMAALGNACRGGFTGVGTNSVTCTGATGVGPKTGFAMLGAVDATNYSVRMTTTGGGQQAVAFGIMTSKITLNKTISPERYSASDQFALDILYPSGDVAGTQATTSGTGLSATTTDTAVVTTLAGESFTLRETATSGSLANYTQSWSCTRNGAAFDVTGTTSVQVTAAIGDNVVCTVTNTKIDPPGAVTARGGQGQEATITPELPSNVDPASLRLLDPAGDPVSTLAVPNEGTWATNPDGTITFTPEAGFTGEPTPVEFVGTAADGTQTPPAAITLKVPDTSDASGIAGVGDPVVVQPVLDEDAVPSTVRILDPAGNPVTELVVANEGTWTVDPTTGAMTFTAEPNFTGDPTPVQYVASDADGNTSQPATATATVASVTVPPVSAAQGQPATITPVFDDVDPASTVVIGPDGNPTKELVVPNEGTWTVNPDGSVTFTPVDGFTGDPTPVGISAALPDGTLLDPVPTELTYAGVSFPSEPIRAAQGEPASVTPTLDPGLDPTTVVLLDPNGNPVKELVVPGEGTWAVDPTTGEVTFTPLPDFEGDPAPVQVTAADAAGNLADPSTLTVRYPDVSDATGTAGPGDPIVVQPVLDTDADPASVRLLDPAGNPVTELVVPGEGTWTVDPATGAMTFTPDAGFTNDPTPVQYVASDANGNVARPATATATVSSVTVPPVAAAEGQPATITPVFDGVDPASAVLIDPAGNPVKSLVVPNEGTWTVNPDGTVTFVPVEGFTGDPTPVGISAALPDGTLLDPVPIQLTYAGVDFPSEPVRAPQGQPATITPTLEPGLDPTTVVLLDPNGNPVKELVVPGEGTWAVDPTTGAVTFTPLPDFEGDPAPVQVTAADAAGNLADPSTLTIKYPDVSDATGTAGPGSPIVVQPVLDEDALPSTVRLLDPAGNPVTELVVPGEGTWTVDPTTGAMTFTPLPGVTADPTPVRYVASDAAGNVTKPATATATVAGVTVPPVAAAEGQPATLTPVYDDVDPATAVLIAPDGSRVKELVVPNEGTWTVNPDGTVSFVPVEGFTGDPTPVGLSATMPDGTFTEPVPMQLTYAGVDFPSEPVRAPQGQPATITPTLEPGLDPSSVVLLDPNGNPVKELVVPGEGTWTVDPTTGAVTFTPLPDFEGDPTPAQVTAADSAGNLADPSPVTIRYPDAANTTATGLDGQPTVITPNLDSDAVPASVRLLDDQGNRVTEKVVPGEGTWSVNPTTGEITFTPEPGYTGNPAPVQFNATDAAGNLARPATLTLTTPGVAPATGAGPQGQPVTIAPQLDPGVDPTSVVLLDAAGNRVKQLVVPGEGTWVVDPVTGAVTFTPEPNFQGDPTPVQVTAANADGTFVTPSTFAINYPDASNVAVTGAEGQPVVITPALDEDAVPNTTRLVGAGGAPVTELVVPGEGTWSVNTTTGAITFTPEEGFTGDPAPVQYVASDAAGNPSLPATITVTTAGMGTTPPASGAQGQPVTITPAFEDGIDPTTTALIDPATGNRVSTLAVPGQGTWVVDPTTGAVTFTPEPGFQGDPAPVQVTAATADGVFADPGTLTINYPDVSDVAPLAPVGSTVTVTPGLDEDIDPSSVVLLNAAGEPVKELVVPGEGTWTVNPDGTVTFVPVDGFTGDPTPVRYTAADAAGNLAQPATMTVNYPQAPAVEALAAPGKPAVFTPKYDEGIDPTSLRLIDPVSGARVTEVVVPGEGTWSVGADGKLTFTPAPGFTGDPKPIQYVVSDTAGNESTPGTATVDYPQVSAATASADQGSPAVFTPVFDDGVDPATAVIIDPATGKGVKQLVVPGEGTWVVNPDGTVVFTPEPGFQGSPTPVDFTAADSAGNLAPLQKLTVIYPDVEEVSAPVTPGEAFTVTPKLGSTMDPTTVSLLDAAGNRVKSLVVPGEGTWTVDPVTGALTFTPEPGFTGVPSPVAYTAADRNGKWALPATITAVDSRPSATPTPSPGVRPPAGPGFPLPNSGALGQWPMAGLALLTVLVAVVGAAVQRRRDR